MTENTEPSSPSHPAPDPEILKSTIRAMKQSEQRANNVPALIKALLCTGTCLLISITGNAIQYWHSTNVEREYFATDNGRLVRLAPTSQPAWSQNDAMAFGSQALATAFNLDFVHYRSQISSLSPRFSDEGFVGYVNALQASNILETIKKEKMNLTATTGAGVLVRQGQMSDGVWFWTFQYPVRMRLVGQTTSKPEQSFVFEITIQRVDPRLKPSGMEIRQMISRTAINQNSEKLASVIAQNGQATRQQMIFSNETQRLEEARKSFTVPDSICSESASGIATESKSASASAASKLSKGGGVSNRSLRDRLASAANSPVREAYDGAAIHASYCTEAEYARFGGTAVCPSVGEIPGGDSQVRSIYHGAGTADTPAALTWDHCANELAAERSERTDPPG